MFIVLDFWIVIHLFLISELWLIFSIGQVPLFDDQKSLNFEFCESNVEWTSYLTTFWLGSLAVVAAITQLGVNITVNMSLEVLALPLVSVSPLSLSVQTGEDLVLRCDVQGLNPRNSTAYLEWVKNKDILSSGQGSYRNNIISIETIEILIKLFCFVKIIIKTFFPKQWACACTHFITICQLIFLQSFIQEMS